MQKKVEPHGEHLRPVRLYLDDLEHILDILHEVSTNVEISAEGYLLDSLSDLQKLHREIITKLEMQTRDPYVSLCLEPNSIWLYIARDDAVSRGAFEKIKSILVQRKRPLTRLLHSHSLVGAFIGLSLIILVSGLISLSPVLVIGGLLTIVASIWWIRYQRQDYFKRYSIVVPKYCTEEPSFIKRNFDKIVVALISALLTGVVTFIVGIITFMVTKLL